MTARLFKFLILNFLLLNDNKMPGMPFFTFVLSGQRKPSFIYFIFFFCRKRSQKTRGLAQRETSTFHGHMKVGKTSLGNGE